MKKIKTWNDYCKVHGDSMYFETNVLNETSIIWENNDVPIKMWDRWIAEYRIIKLMPYYGGAITDEEWLDMNIIKYALARDEHGVMRIYTKGLYSYIAFRSKELLNAFLEHNEELVNKYFGLE